MVLILSQNAEATRTTSASVAMLVGASTTAGTMRMPRWQVVVRPASLGLSNAHSSPLQLIPPKKTVLREPNTGKTLKLSMRR